MKLEANGRYSSEVFGRVIAVNESDVIEVTVDEAEYIFRDSPDSFTAVIEGKRPKPGRPGKQPVTGDDGDAMTTENTAFVPDETKATAQKKGLS